MKKLRNILGRAEFLEMHEGLFQIGTYDVTSGALVVCDSQPAPIMKAQPSKDDPPQYRMLHARNGAWRAFISLTSTSDGRPAALVVSHESCALHPDEIVDGAELGGLLVEGGRVSIVDAAGCEDQALCEEFMYGATESVIEGRGCMSQSGWGDGTYPLRGVTEGNEVIALAAVFDDPANA